MLRSMFSGVAGLRNHQVKMDVLGNNIANVNTYGYKAGRVTFAEMFSQSVSAAAAPSESGNLGGMNPKQIGLGVTNSTMDVLHTAAANQTTDRALDLAINDEGFFAVTDGDKQYYTRSGNLYLDPNGYLVTSNGMYVMGFMLLEEYPEKMQTTVPEIVEKLEADEHIKLENDIDAYAELVDPENEAFPFYLNEEGLSTWEEQFGRMVIPTTYQSISINEEGLITAIDEESNTVTVGVIATATFMNPGGLKRMGENLYVETPNSGIPAISFPGTGNSGPLSPGTLEMSNVDLSKEMTDMIITQRGFQSNSRVITVSDTMLEELVNLKR